MDNRAIIVGVVLGFILAAWLTVWVPSLLSEARQQMCAEGSLHPRHCPPSERPE